MCFLGLPALNYSWRLYLYSTLKETEEQKKTTERNLVSCGTEPRSLIPQPPHPPPPQSPALSRTHRMLELVSLRVSSLGSADLNSTLFSLCWVALESHLTFVSLAFFVPEMSQPAAVWESGCKSWNRALRALKVSDFPGLPLNSEVSLFLIPPLTGIFKSSY